MEEKWISLNEFMRRNNIGYEEAIRLLNSGKIEYQKSEGGRYRIKVGGNIKDKEKEILIKENAELKAIINSLKAILKEVG